jgi:hypothetical protein
MFAFRLEQVPARIFALVYWHHCWQVLEIHAPEPEGAWLPMGKVWGKLRRLRLPIPRLSRKFLESCLAGQPAGRYSDLAYHAKQLGAALYPWRFIQTQLESLGVPISDAELDSEDPHFGQGVWLCQVARIRHEWCLSAWPVRPKQKASPGTTGERSTRDQG